MLDRHTSPHDTQRTMKRISLFVSERQYEEFLAVSAALGQPYAELIREALNAYLQQHAGDVASGMGVARKRVASKERAARKRVRARKRA